MGSWGSTSQTKSPPHPRSGGGAGSRRDFPPGRFPGNCASSLFREGAGGMQGGRHGVTLPPGPGPTFPCPCDPAQTLPGSLQLSRFLSPAPAACTQPAGWPLPQPPLAPRRVLGRWREFAGSLPCLGEGVRWELKRRRRSWSPSWVGGDGPGRRARRGAAPLLTTQLPAHPRRPARARGLAPLTPSTWRPQRPQGACFQCAMICSLLAK